MTIKEKAAKGVIWDFIGLFGQKGIGFLITIFLARLLEPAEFGLVGMSMVFINIFMVFAEFGMSSALIQNKDNSSLTYSSIFYLNILVALLLFLIFQFGAPWIASFFGNRDIENLIRILAFIFPLSALNTVQQAILVRDIDFKRLTLRDLLAQIIAGVIGISMAFMGYGVYSLIIQVMLSIVIRTIILWKITSWYPRIEFSFQEIQKLFGFSIYVFLSQLLNQFTRRFDILMVGRVFNASILGFYSRSATLNQLVGKFSSASIKKVLFPVFSRMNEDRQLFENTFFKLSNLVCFLSFMLSGIMILAGREIIIGLFGPKWEPSVQIFQILALNAMTLPLNSIIISSFMASGKSKQNFWVGNIRKIILVLAVSVSINYGLNTLLYTLVIVGYFGVFLNVIAADLILHLSTIKQFKVISQYIIYFLISILPILYFKPFEQSFLTGISQSLMFVTIYVGLNFVFKSAGFIFLRDNIPFLWRVLGLNLKR